MPFNTLRWRILLIEAALCLALARFVVVFVPFKYWRGLFKELEQKTSEGAPLTAETARRYKPQRRLVGAISRIAPLLPFEALCLPQAMALFWMMSVRGWRGMEIHYGTRVTDQDDFLAHAWLSYEGTVLIGWHDGQFTPIAALT